MPATSPPPGDIHVVLSPTVPDIEILHLQDWLASHGLQLTKLGKTSAGDIDCILLPASRPEPATESGIPEIGPVWNASDVAALIEDRDRALAEVQRLKLVQANDALSWLVEPGNYELMAQHRPDLISRLKKAMG